MHTTLSAEQLTALHAQGRDQARACRFVDPRAAAAAVRVLRLRGEEWAKSVLLRDISRRSRVCSSLPWLETGEMETLVLADRAEWDRLAASLR